MAKLGKARVGHGSTQTGCENRVFATKMHRGVFVFAPSLFPRSPDRLGAGAWRSAGALLQCVGAHSLSVDVFSSPFLP